MATDFRSARFWAEALISGALYDGARAVDATLGNGWDTARLCRLVGVNGRVYGFDVQEEAVARTRERLASEGLADRAELFCLGHEHMGEVIGEPVDAILFNLGWLPGARHAVTTRVETTLAAAEAALTLLKPEGLVTICVYPGHEEGARELRELLAWAEALESSRFDVLHQRYLNQPCDPPQLIAIRKKKKRQAG